MAKTILLDEFHVSIHVAANISTKACTPMRRTLSSKRFQARLRRAIGNVVRRSRSLKSVAIRLSR